MHSVDCDHFCGRRRTIEQLHLRNILSWHYFPLVLTASIYFLKWLLSLAFILSLFQTAVITLFFLALSLSNRLSFSASSPPFFQLSFFSSGFKRPPNSGIYFLSGTLCPKQNSMLITHTLTLSRCLWASHIETRSNPKNCYQSAVVMYFPLSAVSFSYTCGVVAGFMAHFIEAFSEQLGHVFLLSQISAGKAGFDVDPS